MIMFLSASLCLFLFQGGSGTALLSKHTAALQKAQSLSVTFTVQHLPKAPENYRLEFNRNGMLKIETPSGFCWTDGKRVVEYYANGNEYTEVPGGVSALADRLKKDEFAAWAAFFLPDQFKGVTNVTVGGKLTMKGTQVIPVNIADNVKITTLYIDPTTEIARAAAFKTAKAGDSTETLVIASEIKVGDELQEANVFELNLPDGAKKVEFSPADLEKWYETVDEGLKAAKASGRLVFVKFGAEWCGPCKRFDAEVPHTSEFRAMAKYFVFVRVDVDSNKADANRFGVRGIPDFRVLKSDGTQVHGWVGYGGIGHVLSEMEKARQQAEG